MAFTTNRIQFSPLPPGEGPGVRDRRGVYHHEDTAMLDSIRTETSDQNNAKPHAKHLPLPEEHLAFVRKLRRDQTDAESVLWYFLRGKRLGGWKFRRQFPLDPYVLDFYCHDKKLAIELDGGQHNEPNGAIKDEVRKTFIEQRGIRILRFWNHDVLADREAVLQVIWDALQTSNEV